MWAVCGRCRYWTDFLANPQHVADLQAWGINFVRLGFMYVLSQDPLLAGVRAAALCFLDFLVSRGALCV